MTSPSTATEASFEATARRLAERSPRWFRQAGSRGGDYAELFFESSGRRGLIRSASATGRRIRYDHPALAESSGSGVGIRILRGNEMGFAARSSFDEQEIDKAFDEAARRVATGQNAGAGLPAAHGLFDPLFDAGEEELRALTEAAVDAAMGFDERVAGASATYFERARNFAVMNSEGHFAMATTNLLGFRVDVRLLSGDRSVQGFAVGGGAIGPGYFFENPPEDLACEAVRRARVLADARPLLPGRMPVVLAAGWGGVWLHETVGHLLEADRASGFRPGDMLAAPGVTIHDDATLEGGRATTPFDDEGSPTRRTTLVRDGRVESLMTDRHWARRTGLPLTGHARRQDFRFPPLPRMTNLVMDAGSYDPESLVGGVNAGIYVAMPGRGFVLPDEDRFGFEVLEGYRIEHGRIGDPISPVRVEGYVSGALRDIEGIGNDFRLEVARGECEKYGQTVPVSIGMPTVLLAVLDVVALSTVND